MIQPFCFGFLELILIRAISLAGVLAHHTDGGIVQSDRKLGPGHGHVDEVDFLAPRFDVQPPYPGSR